MSTASVLSVFVAAVVIGVLAFITAAAVNDSRRYLVDLPRIKVPVKRPCGCAACTGAVGDSTETVNFAMWEQELST